MPRKQLILALVFVAGGAFAQAQTAWEKGIQAYEAQQYEQALVQFQAAREAGQQGPAVLYNIAVCEYKLEYYARSAASFRQLATQYPAMRGLAEYNLGLVAMQQQEVARARRHFREAYFASPDDEKLRILSSTMLARTEGDIPASSGVNATLGVSFGYDDNVALRDELGTATPAASDSPAAELYGTLEGPYFGDSRLRLDAAAYLVRYFDAGDFDQGLYQAGLVYEPDLGAWHTELGAIGTYNTLGGDGFQRATGVDLRTRRLAGGATTSFRYRHESIDNADARFEGVDGTRQRFDAGIGWQPAIGYLSLGYQLELNDRDNPEVSPRRNRVRLDLHRPLSAAWRLNSGVAYRHSKYDDIAPARTEKRVTARLGVSRYLANGWNFTVSYQYSENDSSDPYFSYERNRIQLGFLGLF